MSGIKMGWDKLKRFLAQANTWSGTQTFANAVIQAGSIAASVVVDLVGELAALTSAVNTAYATVASHATTSAIWTAAGNIINFTGTETITALPAAPQAGAQRILICAGACVFTHAGALTVQGGVTRTCVAGDVVLVTATTTTTFKINFIAHTETGTGSTVRATSPALVTPLLGTPTSGDLSNCSLATPPAIGGTTANTIRAKYDEDIAKTDAAEITANQCAGGVLNNYEQTVDVMIELPAATVGMSFRVILATTVAKYYRIHPDDNDSIYLDGVTTGNGKYVGVVSAAVGNDIQFLACTTAGGVDWFATTVSGPWLAEA